MRKILILLSIAVFTSSSALIANAAEFRKTKVAVVDFQENGTFETKDVGKIVAEWFTTALVNTGRFDVIERRLLQQILEEQKMGMSGLLDPRSVSRLGKVLGVKTVISGTVQSYDGIYEINVRLLNVETGSIITAERFRGGSTSSLNRLVNDSASKIIRHFPLYGYIVKRSDGTTIVDLGREAGARVGMMFKVYIEGAPLKHPKTGEVLSVETVEKGTVRVTSFMDKTADAVIVSETCPACIQAGQLVMAILPEDEPEPMAMQEDKTRLDEEGKREQQFRKDRDKELQKRQDEEKKSAENRRRQEEENAKKNYRQAPVSVQGTFKTLGAHQSDVVAMAVSANGLLAASADKDGLIDVWDLSTWSSLCTLTENSKSVQSVAFSSDGKLLAAAGKSDRVVVWDIARRRQAFTLSLEDTVTSVAFFPTGNSIAIGTKKSRIVIWNFRNNKISDIRADKDVLAVAVSPDGKYIVSGGQDKNLTLWDSSNGSRIRTMTGHSNDVTSVLFSPGGKQIVSAGSDKKIVVWETGTGDIKFQLAGHDNSIIALGISKDGRRLTSSESERGGGMLFVWDLGSGKELKRIKMSQRAYSMTLTPDGRYAVTGSDKYIHVYAVE
ncbi:MAG: FlgO family outer membrane protein [Desulfuromonadales bacterium]